MKAAVALAAALAAGFLLALPAGALGGTPAADMMAFADHLFESGDYYRAITEYERVAFRYPDDAAAVTARFRIAMSYYRGERYSLASRHFRAFADRHPGDALGREAAFMVAESLYKGSEFESAIAALAALLERYPGGPDADRALVLLGRCHLRLGNWERASETFEAVPPDSTYRETAGGLARGAREYPNLRMKSPALAGTLSALLPGAGQVYIGRTGDAAAAFLLNALFVWAAVEAFDKGNDVTGGILLAFEAGWYAGNIVNAVGGAHQYNRRLRQQYLDGLQNRYGRPDGGRFRGPYVEVVSFRY